MTPTIKEGTLNGSGKKFAIIMSKFNETISDQLLKGALNGLQKCGVRSEDIEVFRVPGAFELPLLAQKVCKQKKFSAVIALGVVIKGATPHNDYISSAAISGLSTIMRETDTPIAMGVLTCNTIEEAVERSGTKMGNKGYDMALAAVELSTLYHKPF